MARAEVARRESEMERLKTAYSNARPPRWAESFLRLLLKPEDRESVRQLTSFVLRASWIWGGILGAALVIRYLLDTLAPPTDYFLRATILTYTIMAACLLTGFSTAWRGRSLRAGILVSFCAATIGALISVVGTSGMLAIWHDAATLDAWRRSGVWTRRLSTCR